MEETSVVNWATTFQFFPPDVLVEIFLFSGARAGVRILSTCKALRDVWYYLDDTEKKTTELMYFKFVQAHQLAPPPIDLSGCYKSVEQEELERFLLPAGFTLWRDVCRARFRMALACVNCKFEHQGNGPTSFLTNKDSKKSITQSHKMTKVDTPVVVVPTKHNS
jgi:hypothetical protein